MGEEPVTFATLLRFHREILVPEVERIVGSSEQRLRDEVQTGFDALAQRLDRLETEYQMLVAGLRRVEERLDSIDERMALRTEVQELRAKVASLEARIAQLESEL